MGSFFKISEIDEILNEYNNKVIILCTDYMPFKEKFKFFYEISLGESLAAKLSSHPIEDRYKKVLFELDNLLLKSNHKKILVKDIDILFNPKYKLEVLKYFINLAKYKDIVVLWNGISTNEYLQYAEIGYLEYKRYLVKNYDIICIK